MIYPFLPADIDSFLASAKDEGWLCDRWELEFLLGNFPQGCFVHREAGAGIGCVTAAKYGRSGWIGNLLVHPAARRRGIGRGLMELSISALRASGVETVWLTASDQGAGIYRRLGFSPIDQINRWSGKGEASISGERVPVDMELVAMLDSDGWGGRRDPLLRAARERGPFYTRPGGFICCQQWEEATQIGPWGCLTAKPAGALLDQALAVAGEPVFLDVPLSNHAATGLLEGKRFAVQGTTVLMYLGRRPLYQPEKIFALASMGSMG